MIRRRLLALITFCFVLAAFALLAAPTNAQTNYYTTDATINYGGFNYAEVGIFINYHPIYNPTVDIVTGANILHGVDVYGGVVNMSGGSADGYLETLNSGIANISGGTVGQVRLSNDSVVNVSGGQIGSYVLSDSAQLTLIGSNLTYTHPYSYRDNYHGMYDEYDVSGTLQDGTVLKDESIVIYFGGTAGFNLNAVSVPEPGMLALVVGFGISGVGMYLGRRRN